MVKLSKNLLACLKMQKPINKSGWGRQLQGHSDCLQSYDLHKVYQNSLRYFSHQCLTLIMKRGFKHSEAFVRCVHLQEGQPEGATSCSKTCCLCNGSFSTTLSDFLYQQSVKSSGPVLRSVSHFPLSGMSTCKNPKHMCELPLRSRPFLSLLWPEMTHCTHTHTHTLFYFYSLYP